jgi:hypothetical protein
MNASFTCYSACRARTELGTGRVQMIELIGGPGRIQTCDLTVMSGVV